MKKIFLISLCVFGFHAIAEIIITTKPSQGRVEFEATGKPAMIKIKGEGEGATSDLKIVDQKLNGEVKFKIDSLKTGINLRDQHMKEKYLQSQEHPQAILLFKDFKLPADWTPQKATAKKIDFQATLKLHGVEKPVNGILSIDSNKLDSSAQFEVKLSDFKIDIPEYLGVKVADTVKVKVSFNDMTLKETAAVNEKPKAKK